MRILMETAVAVVALIAFALGAVAESSLPIIPRAKGFGMDTIAGSGRHLDPPETTVRRVINLNDSGPGSLRAALEVEGPHFMNLETMCYSGYSKFDAFLFYNRDQWPFYESTPETPKLLQRQIDRIHERTEAGLEHIVKNGQGIFVLHHAMHCFLFPEPEPRWGQILNMDNFMYRSVSMSDVHTEIANPDHPITKGLEAWDMKDEVFLMDDPNEGSDILLTTENPESMKVLGWTTC